MWNTANRAPRSRSCGVKKVAVHRNRRSSATCKPRSGRLLHLPLSPSLHALHTERALPNRRRWAEVRCWEFGFSYVALLLSPTVAGILLTGLVDGRAGLSELRSRLLRWRVGARWWTTAGSRAWRAWDHVVVAVAMLANVVEGTFYVVR